MKTARVSMANLRRARVTTLEGFMKYLQKSGIPMGSDLEGQPTLLRSLDYNYTYDKFTEVFTVRYGTDLGESNNSGTYTGRRSYQYEPFTSPWASAASKQWGTSSLDDLHDTMAGFYGNKNKKKR